MSFPVSSFPRSAELRETAENFSLLIGIIRDGVLCVTSISQIRFDQSERAGFNASVKSDCQEIEEWRRI